MTIYTTKQAIDQAINALTTALPFLEETLEDMQWEVDIDDEGEVVEGTDEDLATRYCDIRHAGSHAYQTIEDLQNFRKTLKE